jgi:phosphinothricin acetyltransferase
MVATLTLRNATETDLPGILAIYNHAVLNTTATADYEIQSLEARAAWYRERIAAGYPVLVAESEGRVVGWAAIGCYIPRYGYRFTAEDSVYVAPEAKGKGVGTALLKAICDEADRMGLHVLVAKIDSANEASLRLHARFGFVQDGYFKEQIYKFDRWLDVVHMQRVNHP